MNKYQQYQMRNQGLLILGCEIELNYSGTDNTAVVQHIRPPTLHFYSRPRVFTDTTVRACKVLVANRV
jgi:hypothetical protein